MKIMNQPTVNENHDYSKMENKEENNNHEKKLKTDHVYTYERRKTILRKRVIKPKNVSSNLILEIAQL